MSDIHHYYPNLDATTTTAAANNNNEPLLPPPSSSSNQWYNGTHNITEVTVSVSDPNMILTGVLMALVVTFSLILCYLTFPAVADWLRNNCKACMPAMASPARVQRRYETIEGWLISKRVRAHCDTCEQLQSQYGCGDGCHKQQQHEKKLPRVKLAASYDTAETVLEGGPYDYDDTEEEGRECPVCMECFAVNDIVSWSPCAKTCDHVFHHSCIKQWLLHHECCPYCRVTVLPVDRDAASNTVNADAAAAAADDANNNATTTTYFGVTMTTSAATSSSSSSAAKQQWTVQQLAALAAKRSQRVMTTYYCLDEGLVTLDRSPSSTAAAAASTTAATKDDRKKVLAMKRFLSTGIQQGELAELRGAGSKGGNSSGRAMDDQEIVVSVQAPAQNNNSNHRDNGDADDDVVAANGGSPATVPSAVEATRGGNPPPQTLHFADAVVDIEMCLMQLRVISNDVAGGQQLGEEDEVPSSR